MGSVPGTLFGHQPKTTTVQPICIDQNSGQIRKLGEDQQPIAIRRRLNSALESVGGKIRSAAAGRRRTVSSSNRRTSTSFQQKIQQTEKLNELKMRFSESESERRKIGLEKLEMSNERKTSLEQIKDLIKKKTSKEEENVAVFNTLSGNHTENQLESSHCSEQTTTKTFARHKEKEFTYSNLNKEEKNKCDDNDDVEILIDVKNEEIEINSALTDTFYIEKKKSKLETQHSQQQSQSSSSPPSLSPLRTRLWTAPVEEKRIQQKQPCKAVFRSAQRRSATGIRRADKHLKEETSLSLLVDLEGICLDEKSLNNDKIEKEERKTSNTESFSESTIPTSSSLTTERLSNTENKLGEGKKNIIVSNSAKSRDSGIDF
ncbi:hypothetical protein ACQ4LE_009245 [Meloidogyne hapla]|uniref:Uncharacterized protein n=1 Tax=Meloidogyne hapla TaxID=6305 RepID=A0A1I8B9D5_MELHA